MKKTKLLMTFGMLAILMLVMTTSAYGGQEKVDVCHVTGTYDFGNGEVPIGHVITIADPAYETHIAHSDPEVWNIVTLSDGSEVCTATVNPVNTPPIALDDAYSTDEDTTLAIPALEGVLANDGDVDGDSLSAALVTGPSNGTLYLNPDGSFSYTPDADYYGTDSFTYAANDGTEDSNAANVTITVNPVNDTPTAAADVYSMDEDTTLTVSAPGVLANDADADGDSLSAALVTGPSNGALTLNPDGSFSYNPDADYHGTDSFTYAANDGTEDSNAATVTIIVNPVNEVPTQATVFLTSQTYTGATLGGLPGADAQCQAGAEAAGLEGTYMAWLSSSIVDARDRLTHADIPYVMTDGTQIADNWADLVGGYLDSEFKMTEFGTELWPIQNILTASWFSGVYYQQEDCSGWTSDSNEYPMNGGDNYYTSTWSFSMESSIYCDSPVHLYCFEQVVADPKTVFVTSQSYQGYDLGGLDGADAKCQARADAAGLEGTYKAWLSSSTVDARDRLNHSDVLYIRVDGIPIANTWADLTDRSLDAPIRLNEYGLQAAVYVWTGTESDGTFASGGLTDCGGWASEGDADFSKVGDSHDPGESWTASDNAYFCGNTAPLYCFEQ